MKKTSLRNIANYIANIPELANEYAELSAELTKDEAKASANRSVYEAAHDVIMSVLGAAPRTVSEIFNECANELPEGFSKSKIQYALLNYWKDEIVKIEVAKGANQYRRA